MADWPNNWKRPHLTFMGALLSSFLLTLNPSIAGSKGFRLDERTSYTGKPYETLRRMLVLAGWEPEKEVHGPYEDYPEIHCSAAGPCVGYWRKQDLRELYVDVHVLQEILITESIQTDREYKREHAN
jgi:hypothetical protein